MSVPYLSISLNRYKITSHIQMRHYATFCLVNSIISLIMPISKTILHYIIKDNQNERITIILLYMSSAFFLFYLNYCWYFRANCCYAEYILSSEGACPLNKALFGLKLLFCVVEIPKPNFIDFNNAFIYHSLAYTNDFNRGGTTIRASSMADYRASNPNN